MGGVSRVIVHLKAGTLLQTTRRWLYYRAWNANAGDASRPNRVHIWCRDFLNCRRYGKDAPQFAELIYVDPRACLVSNRAFLCGQICSARVIDYWPYQEGDLAPVLSVAQLPIESAAVGILQSCLQHWRDGVPWVDTWNYQRIAADIQTHGMFYAHQLRSIAELDTRCKKLDALFKRVLEDGEMPLRSAYAPGSFRQEDNTMIHVGPKGELVVAGLGLHRFSIAMVAGLTVVPAQIGCVHVDALHVLPALRSMRRQEGGDKGTVHYFV